MNIGERLKECRMSRELSKATAAKEIGVRRSTILNIERGANPSIKTFKKIASWVGMYDEEILQFVRQQHAVVFKQTEDVAARSETENKLVYDPT